MRAPRQVAIVLCCLFGIAVAAMGAPAADAPVSPTTPVPEPTATPELEPPDAEEPPEPERPATTPLPPVDCDDGGCEFRAGGPCQGEDCRGGADYEIRVDPEPVPGQRVTVTVAYRGEPAAGIAVLFNQPDGGWRSIGVTGGDGRVTGQVPYVRELRLSLRRTGEPRAAIASAGGRQYAVSRQPLQQVSQQQNRTIRMDSFGEVEVVTGEHLPGRTVTIEATVEGVPFRNATVSLDDERVGRTTGAGRYELRLPDDGRERVEVRVERGEIAAREHIDIRVLDVRIRPSTAIALPGTNVTVDATAGGEPLDDAAVRLDGATVAQTDGDGEATVHLPWRNSATVAVRGAEQTTTKRLDGLFVALALVVVVFGGVIGGIIAVGYRAGIVPRGVGGREVGGRLRAAARSVWDTLGYLAQGQGRASERIRVVLARGRQRLGDALARVPQLVERALTRVGERTTGLVTGAIALPVRAGALVFDRQRARAASRRAYRRLVAAGVNARQQVWVTCRAIGALVVGVVSGLAGLARGDIGDLFGSDETRATETEPTADEAEPTEAEGAEERTVSLPALWGRFARRVWPQRWRRRTPGEVARHAIDQGLPAEAVQELTDAFRAAEYAPSGATEPQQRAARQALERIERAIEEDGQ
jgi:hypothetical protein